MHNILTPLDFDLRMFDGTAGAASAGGEGGTAQSDVGATPKAETIARSGSSRRSKSGDPIVVYGKQEDASAADNTSDPVAGDNGQGVSKVDPEAKRKAFAELIKGEYKDEYTESTQQVINRRFKEAKVNEQTLAAQKPIIDIMLQKYGIADGDMRKLQTAIEEDTTMWEAAAEEAGLTVEQYRKNQQLVRENAELRRMEQQWQMVTEAQRRERAAQQQLAQWNAQGEQLKELYPSFDFATEAGNKDFVDLLRRGLSVQNAYELIHMEDIKNATAKTAAKTADAQMRARLQSKASRPTENGTSQQSAVITKSDVHSLTKADREAAARQALRGEKIRW